MAPEDAAAGLGVFFIPLLSSSRVVFFSRWALWGLASRTRFAKNPFFLARGRASLPVKTAPTRTYLSVQVLLTLLIA